MTDARETPISSYRARLATGALAPDPMQERAVEMLHTLHIRLLHYHQGRPEGVLQRLLGRDRREPAPMGLYLYGDVGRGKSMLMDLFFDTAVVAAKRRVHFHAFMLEVHDFIHQWRQRDAAARAALAAETGADQDDVLGPLVARLATGSQLLCFDEFQVTNIADAMILGRLFEGLLAQGVVIVATSNTAPDRLYERGLNRELFLPFIDLIKARLDLLHLESPTDYRLERMKGVPVYHTPLGPAARAELDATFRRLTDLDHGPADEFEVKGRVLPVPEAAKGVARFSFAELCGTALGAADYLALAGRYHTLLIDDIPLLGDDRADQARRFITLIDALYEHKLRLVCSAAAPADALYTASHGANTFARTASRLIEMQSAGYPGR